MTAQETLSFSEFARQRGWKPGYVTELRKAGRLVLTEDGKRVRVAESLRRIDDTRDPARTGVSARHAATRGQGGDGAALGGDASAAGEDAADEPLVEPADPISMRRARAQAEREEALLRKALRDEQIELGDLLPREDVIAAIAATTTTLRTSLETLPFTLAPELAAAAHEDRCRVLLASAIEHALDELSRRFGAIGRAA